MAGESPISAEHVAAAVKRAFSLQGPGDALLGLSAQLADLSERPGGELREVFEAFAPQGPSESSATAPQEALALALVDGAGRSRRTEARFAAWLGDPADLVDGQALLARARSSGVAAGTVRADPSGVFAVLALDAARAAGWPWVAARLGQTPRPRDLLLIAYAPSRSETLVRRSARALGLTDLEGRLAAQLMVSPSLEAAAETLSLGRETAKDAVERAMRKAGARRSQDLVGRLLELVCEARQAPAAGPGLALGLSPAEHAVAGRLARGETVKEAAAQLGLSPETVKTHRKAIFGRLGVSKDRDLRRLIIETAELERLASADELLAQPDAERSGEPAAARFLPAPDGRLVACLDYGPRKGRPLILMHGYSTGRTAPPPLLEALAARGWRVITPQRPGFGHTSPPAGDYLETAVADLVLVLDSLECQGASLIARDGGVACALAFAQRHAGRAGPSLLLNPRRPRDVRRDARGALTGLALMLLRHPDLIDPWARLAARHSARRAQLASMRRLFQDYPADLRAFGDPAVAERLLDDARGLNRSYLGAIAELRLFAEGWRPPADYCGPSWRLALSAEISAPSDGEVWGGVVGEAPVFLPGAGFLAQFTHAEDIAALLPA